jgi:hypothetical protein
MEIVSDNSMRKLNTNNLNKTSTLPGNTSVAGAVSVPDR